MVGGGNNYCLDVFVVEDGAKIFVAFALPSVRSRARFRLGWNGSAMAMASTWPERGSPSGPN